MITSILIANRGEIASRIIRTCRRLGIRSVAVYADPDKNLPFVQEADEAIALGGNAANESYLVQDKIIHAAQRTQVDAIHPGFGFLSENGDFARRCQAEGFIFIGPNPEAIDAMGLKSTAKAIMEEHGVPTIKGYRGDNQSLDFLVEQANKIGYPILIKAIAGGGGKGMRIANNPEEVQTAIEGAQREAQNSFGNSTIMLERYFPSARHIEFQIFGDQQGNVIHLLERECSLQRRYQKVVEESPSIALDESLRTQMGKAAITAAKAIQYDNAGTVEFILTNDNEFYFLEVNTRLQVEHPVTEMITGLDLVEWQILIASGHALPLSQEAVTSNGYAIECRLYAEDALNNFFPATGTILHWETTELEGLRYETGVQSGSEVSIYYDPMLAKVIAHAPTRQIAIQKMIYALQQLKCLGVTTNQAFLIALLQDKVMLPGTYDTNFIGRSFNLDVLTTHQQAGAHITPIAALLYRWHQREQQRSLVPKLSSGWRSNFYQAQVEQYESNDTTIPVHYRYHNGNFDIAIHENNYAVQLIDIQKEQLTISIDGQHHKLYLCQSNDEYYVHHNRFGQVQTRLLPRFPEVTTQKIKGGYQAPMPSEVLKIAVEVGQKVTEGEALITLLSMKMENTVTAHETGIVTEILVEEGASIAKDTLLLKINTEA